MNKGKKWDLENKKLFPTSLQNPLHQLINLKSKNGQTTPMEYFKTRLSIIYRKKIINKDYDLNNAIKTLI